MKSTDLWSWIFQFIWFIRMPNDLDNLHEKPFIKVNEIVAKSRKQSNLRLKSSSKEHLNFFVYKQFHLRSIRESLDHSRTTKNSFSIAHFNLYKWLGRGFVPFWKPNKLNNFSRFGNWKLGRIWVLVAELIIFNTRPIGIITTFM